MPSKLQDYDILSEIGSGSYGTCKKVRRRTDNKVHYSNTQNSLDPTASDKFAREFAHGKILPMDFNFVSRFHNGGTNCY